MTANVTAANLVLGPAALYVAAMGATEPADASVTPNGYLTPPGAPWTDVGGTDGGVTFELSQTLQALEVDQVTMQVGARVTESAMTVTAKLSEMTFANMQTAINNIGVVATETGYQTMEIPVGTTATQPGYMALIIDGWAPMTMSGTPALRRIIVRKVLSQVKASLVFDKKTQDSFDCTFQCYYISSGTNPVKIIDELV